MTKEFIMEQLQKQKERLENDLGYTVAYICVYGSQNYGLDLYTEEYQSDLDLKAVIIPTLNDLVYNCKPVSTKLDYEYGEIDLKDIRVYIDTLVKANPAYVETLFTEYRIVDSNFAKEMEEIFNLKEDLVYALRFQFLRAMYGMMKEKEKAMCHPYPSTVNKIEKYGFDSKQTSHIIRLYCMMCGYFVDKKKLEDCFYPTEEAKKLILEHKLYNISFKDAKVDVDYYLFLGKTLKDRILELNKEEEIDYSVKNRVIRLSRNIIKSSIIRRIIKEYEVPKICIERI